MVNGTKDEVKKLIEANLKRADETHLTCEFGIDAHWFRVESSRNSRCGYSLILDGKQVAYGTIANLTSYLFGMFSIDRPEPTTIGELVTRTEEQEAFEAMFEDRDAHVVDLDDDDDFEDDDDNIEIVEDAMEKLAEVIELLEQVEGDPAGLKSYILPTLKCRLNNEHEYLSRDENLQDVLDALNS